MSTPARLLDRQHNKDVKTHLHVYDLKYEDGRDRWLAVDLVTNKGSYQLAIIAQPLENITMRVLTRFKNVNKGMAEALKKPLKISANMAEWEAAALTNAEAEGVKREHAVRHSH